MTGNGDNEATIPGKWAAPPAPAIITPIPSRCAFLLKLNSFSGVLWADTMSTITAILKDFKKSMASCITGRSLVLPIITATFFIYFYLRLFLNCCG